LAQVHALKVDTGADAVWPEQAREARREGCGGQRAILPCRHWRVARARVERGPRAASPRDDLDGRGTAKRGRVGAPRGDVGEALPLILAVPFLRAQVRQLELRGAAHDVPAKGLG